MQTTNSQHSYARMQQRSIPQVVIDLLEECGSAMRSHGAERLFFDKAARRRLSEKLGKERGIKSIERYLNIYAVIGDNGILITAGRRTRRFKRDI